MSVEPPSRRAAFTPLQLATIGNELGLRSQRAFVVDDTSQARAGRKVQGTSVYFDHTEGRSQGHQVLQLGLAAEKESLAMG